MRFARSFWPAVFLLASSVAAAEETPDKDGKPAATYRVEQGPFKVEVTLKGVFEAAHMTPFALHLEGWTKQQGSPLMVHRAVEQGSHVRKGETLLWLDLERLDQAIRDLEADRHLEEVTQHLSEKELLLLEQAAPLEVAVQERSKIGAEEDLKRFLQSGRAFSEKWADLHLKSARNYHEYAQEELRQLEKMYKANDITEETEEIILKRQRNQLEFAAFLVKQAEKDHEETYKIDLPRRDRTLHEQAQRQALSLDKLRLTQPLQLTQKRLALEKLRYDHGKISQRLARLKRDRELLACTSPVDGVVYYGRCVQGHWTSQASMADRLQRGGEVHPEEVILTLVQPRPMFVRAEVDEKDLQHVQAGLAARIVPTGHAERKVAGRIEQVSAIPVAAGKFMARVELDSPAAEGPWMPGMACSIKVTPYRRDDALTLPASAVFTDELDEDRHYVYLVGPRLAPTRRDVKIGPKTEQRVVILEGLHAGDEVLQQKPGDAAKKGAKS